MGQLLAGLLKPLDGWKTQIAAVGILLLALNQHFSWITDPNILTWFVVGLSSWTGISVGHALAKNSDEPTPPAAGV